MALLDAYSGPWTSAEAAHLARRTTFGATPLTLANMVSAGMSSAVDEIVDYPAIDTALEAKIAALPETSTTSDSYRIKYPSAINHLEGWWLYRMVNCSFPLQQQFALFQHDHFVSEYTKTAANVSNSLNYGNDGNPPAGVTQSCTKASGGLPYDTTRRIKTILRILRDQHNLFLTIGHEGFKNMLIAITRDPCMLIYLDNRLNKKGKPQENYGREIMELFTMGVGNYSEQDVREVSRAFTGETINVSCSSNWPYNYIFDAAQHDTASKNVFGVTFNQSGSNDTLLVIDLLLSRISGSNVSPYHKTVPATPLYMAWKLITWFVHESIPMSHEAVRDLALVFDSTINGIRYNVRETMRTLFKSQFFYDTAYCYNMYKHPADYVVMALRGLELNDTSYTGSVYSWLRQMGMQLFEPPTVEGWHHGKSWINSSSLIARYNYADRIATSLMTTVGMDDLISSGKIANRVDHDGIRNYVTSRLLHDYTLTTDEVNIFNRMFINIDNGSPPTLSGYYRKVRAAIHLTMSMPRYQLK